MTTDELILVIGATGKTGSRVAARLAGLGRSVRLGSRAGSPAFDWEVPSTWEPALHGVTAAYVTYYPDSAIPGAAAVVRRFVEVALAAGVRRLVFLSGRGEEEAQACEEVLRSSEAEWTIVRCSWFMQNFSEGIFVDDVLAGSVSLPAGPVGEPFVDVSDIADVVVAALTSPGHVGQLYELTGPRLLSFADAVAEIAAASGRAVAYEDVSPEKFRAMLDEAAVPEEVTEFLVYLFGEVMDGRNAYLTDDVERVLGRKPRDFAEYARETAASGVWSPVAV